ncbi:amidohydrolase family protein [Variovorax sp. V116]|uniref:amidohydrolase family protein n=1 Tax=Variovorax sp. V116 TaxID=3065953 RepID=UPI0034E8BB68
MGVALVRAKWLVTGIQDRDTPQVIGDGAVAHQDGKVVALGEYEEIRQRYLEAPVTHHGRHALLPGFVNSHHHVGLTPLQLGSPDYALELWFASRLSARDVDSYLDTLYSAFEMIASGITTVQHIHGWLRGSYEQVHGAASAVLKAYQGIGMRASYCYAVREQNRFVYEDDARFCAGLPAEIGAPLLENLRQATMSFDQHVQLYRQLRAENQHPLTRVQLAPANLHWITDDGLMKLVALAKADNVPMHMHLLETAYQKEYATRRTGTTAVRHLEDLGALGPWLTLGHAVWLTAEDVERVAHSGTCVCHNCSSNFRLRSGVAPINDLSRRGVTIGLGLDEAGINEDRDMLQEMKLALRVHRVPGMDEGEVPSVPQILQMATEHGARTTAFRGEIGRLDVGLNFDAVVIDYESATYPYQDEDVPMLDVLIQRAQQKHVEAVYVGGDPIYSNGVFKYIDRDKALADLAAQLARPKTAEEQARRRLSKAVFPHVKAFYDNYLGTEQVRQPFYRASSRS